MKPENVLLINPQKAAIKLIDFGSSCFLAERLHTYIQSRFYRAPEIMLGVPYTSAIDIWSLGCILVELYTGQPLWPGECEKDQLLHIISYLGLPPEQLMQNACRKNLFFEENRLKSDKISDGKVITPAMHSLKAVFKAGDKDFGNFIEMCLEWEPEKRLTPTQGLAHPWITHNKVQKTVIVDKRLKKK